MIRLRGNVVQLSSARQTEFRAIPPSRARQHGEIAGTGGLDLGNYARSDLLAAAGRAIGQSLGQSPAKLVGGSSGSSRVSWPLHPANSGVLFRGWGATIDLGELKRSIRGVITSKFTI